MLEIIGYTAIIYFLGGIEALYLIPIYIILISYVGIVSSRRLPFIIAGICSLCLTGMLVLVHLGFLPQMNVISGFYIPWENQLTNLFVIVGFLFVSAFISSYIAAINRRNREILTVLFGSVSDLSPTGQKRTLTKQNSARWWGQ